MIECAGCGKNIGETEDRIAEFVGGECIYFHNEICKKKWIQKGEQRAETKDYYLIVNKQNNLIEILPKES